MVDVVTFFDEQERRARDQVAFVASLRSRTSPIADLLAMSAWTMVLGNQIVIEHAVTSFADDGAALIEAYQDALGVEFDKSHDYPDGPWRQFEASGAPWLRVDLRPRSDSPACRVVQVGTRVEPVYEIRCEQ